MNPPRPTHLAQVILRDAIEEGDTVIDATAGNGHDTVFLAGCVGEKGRVLAFDPQEKAIRSARSRVDAAGLGCRVDFYQTSHSRMAEHAEAGSISTVMFNLGYLPGDDHAMTTESQETLLALAATEGVLKSGGVLSVVCYPGHPAGAVEAAAVEAWLSSRAAYGWRTAKYGMLGTLQPAPYLLLARKA